jgi:DNA-binding transcriptional ArsR family regulator
MIVPSVKKRISEEGSMVQDHVAEADQVGDVVGILRTLSDPTRLRLLSALQDGEHSVSALCDQLNLAQPTVSHHLGRLRSARLVANRRDGKRVYYSLNGAMVSERKDTSSLAIAAGALELRIRRTIANGDGANRTVGG